MANIFDYMAWRKDVPFTVSPFNEVDGLVLSELIYADLSGCVVEDGEKVPLSAVRERFWQRHTKEEIMADDSFTKTAPFLMDDMLDGARFAGTSVSWFYDVVDTAADIQLAVATFWLPDGTAFVAFRGTDSTIVGWKEDFLLSYLPETEGQRRAAAYMDVRQFGGVCRGRRVPGGAEQDHGGVQQRRPRLPGRVHPVRSVQGNAAAHHQHRAGGKHDRYPAFQ